MSKPYRPWVAAAAAATLAASLPAPPVSAETVVVGDQVMVRQTEVPHPKRGMSMAEVQKHFGDPRERHPTVGTPPITRWDYPNFAVFFEKDLVIDAVVPGAASPAAPSTPSGTPDADPIPVAAPAGAAPAVQSADAQPTAPAPAAAAAATSAPASESASAASQKANGKSKGDVPLSDVSLHH
ncbi:MAG TPA: hypothetical protein VMF64_12050 [Steroidobacteraceae bacterium]|nr:hypothetical protein [Steroidobacteraceae bacterium]